MNLEERIDRLEKDTTEMQPVVKLSERLLAELMKSDAPPARLEQAHGFLRSARDLLKHGEQETAGKLAGQAEETLDSVRQWLAVADLGISPFLLRTHMEKNPLDAELQLALIRYFLSKRPHAENDRDKLDYLLSAYVALDDPGQSLRAEPLARKVEELVGDLPRPELTPAAETMLHELESLIARVPEFTDFDQMVHARMVERARALKINLGESFYHPRVLPVVIHFNRAFRRHFEKLFHEQLSAVREVVREQIEEAWALTRAIESACEKLALPEEERTSGAADLEEEEADARLGRPLEPLEERPPIDRLIRRGEDRQKEKELRGIITRLTRFLEKLPAEQAAQDKVVFALRESKIDLASWEREAFVPAAAKSAPQSTGAIQSALGVVAWVEEELARYHRTRGDRYMWKTHFDLLSYAVVRTVDLLKHIRDLVREDAPDNEATWFRPLLQTSLRLATTLNKVGPVFAEPDEAQPAAS